MKKFTLFFMLFIFWFTIYSQTRHMITASGFDFVPDEITVTIGDTIEFNVGPTHPVLEVSQDTWNADESTGLDGGFSFSSGEGEIVVNEAKTHYYICTNHISSGMKGKIIVEDASTSIMFSEPVIQSISFYPNPVKNYATIDFTMNQSDQVFINLYNLLGSRVKEIRNGFLPQGDYSLSANFTDLPEGIYYLTIETKENKESLKVIK